MGKKTLDGWKNIHLLFLHSLAKLLHFVSEIFSLSKSFAFVSKKCVLSQNYRIHLQKIVLDSP